MTKVTIHEVLNNWLGDDKAKRHDRIAWLSQEAPIAEATINAISCGRYNPGALLERRLRDIFNSHPRGAPLPAKMNVG